MSKAVQAEPAAEFISHDLAKLPPTSVSGNVSLTSIGQPDASGLVPIVAAGTVNISGFFGGKRDFTFTTSVPAKAVEGYAVGTSYPFTYNDK